MQNKDILWTHVDAMYIFDIGNGQIGHLIDSSYLFQFQLQAVQEISGGRQAFFTIFGHLTSGILHSILFVNILGPSNPFSHGLEFTLLTLTRVVCYAIKSILPCVGNLVFSNLCMTNHNLFFFFFFYFYVASQTEEHAAMGAASAMGP